jgi:hypothetical protein
VRGAAAVTAIVVDGRVGLRHRTCFFRCVVRRRHFDPILKDLIRRLLTADRSKRLGCLRGGADDIKAHRWFARTNWDAVYKCAIPAPFLPKVSTLSAHPTPHTTHHTPHTTHHTPHTTHHTPHTTHYTPHTPHPTPHTHTHTHHSA